MLSDELRRGEQARLLLQNEIYADAIDKVRQGIVDKWVACPIRDREGAHELKLMLKVLDEITGYVKTTMETGKMAQIQLESERRMDKLKAVGI